MISLDEMIEQTGLGASRVNDILTGALAGTPQLISWVSHKAGDSAFRKQLWSGMAFRCIQSRCRRAGVDLYVEESTEPRRKEGEKHHFLLVTDNEHHKPPDSGPKGGE